MTSDIKSRLDKMECSLPSLPGLSGSVGCPKSFQSVSPFSGASGRGSVLDILADPHDIVSVCGSVPPPSSPPPASSNQPEVPAVDGSFVVSWTYSNFLTQIHSVLGPEICPQPPPVVDESHSEVFRGIPQASASPC